MEMSEAKKRANKKWNDENLKIKYDRIQIVVPKGKKETIQSHAKEQGESLNGFINRIIDEAIERDNTILKDNVVKDTSQPQPTELKKRTVTDMDEYIKQRERDGLA